jgi:IstB-like ATP binding protein
MERTQIFDLMSELKLFGMRTAYDEIMALAIKRQHEPPQIVGDLLAAEIAEKQARSSKYQLTIAKLPLAKDLDDFDFDAAAVNKTLARDLARGGFVAQQRNISPSPLGAAASAPDCAAASPTQSTLSTGWRPKRAPAARVGSPTI